MCLGQALAAWEFITCFWHRCEFQLTKRKAGEAVGLPGWGPNPDREMSAIIFQGNRDQHNYAPRQKPRCWRWSSPKQRGSSRKEESLPCWEALFLESDMQRDACTILHVKEQKCRVPYGSGLPDVPSTWWQGLPVIAWPFFPPHEKCSWGREAFADNVSRQTPGNPASCVRKRKDLSCFTRPRELKTLRVVSRSRRARIFSDPFSSPRKTEKKLIPTFWDGLKSKPWKNRTVPCARSVMTQSHFRWDCLSVSQERCHSWLIWLISRMPWLWDLLRS